MKIILATAVLLAHSWYPYACCHDQNCHPVPCGSIKKTALGLSWNGITFTEPMIHDSLDANCHVCVSTDGRYIYPSCIFVHKPKSA
jgi:hypothetical protein